MVSARKPLADRTLWHFGRIGSRPSRRAVAAVAVLSELSGQNGAAPLPSSAVAVLPGCATSSGGAHRRSTARAGLIRALRVVTCIMLGTTSTPRASVASFGARRLTPRSSGAPTAYHQRPAGGTRYIFATRALAACRRRPLSSYVRPRMPTITGPSPFFEIQQRAQRGTSAFAAFCVHFRLWRGGQSPNPSLQRSASGSVGLGASAPGCGQQREGQAPQWRTCRVPVRNFISVRAVASLVRTVQGLTPRSSGAPTAAHQARSVVGEHSPQPGPGVLPLSPA